MLEPFGNPHNFNKPMVDRMLGIAYERVKQVQENLESLQYFVDHLSAIEEGKESMEALTEKLNSIPNSVGIIGNTLGHVGEDGEFQETIEAGYFIRALSAALPYYKTLAENIEYIYKNGVFIKDIIAVSLALESVKNVADKLPDISKVNTFKEEIQITSANISEIVSLVQNITALLTVANNISDVNIVTDSITSLKNISNNIHSLVTLSDNMLDYKRANSYYSTFKEVLDNKDLISLIAENQEAVTYIADNQDKLTALSDNQEAISSLTAFIDTFTLLALHIEDIHKVVDNLELIKEYADMSDKITALYSALYPNAKATTVIADPNQKIQDLLNDVDSSTRIILSRDTTENLVIPSGKIINLDLNGYKLTNQLEADTIYVELGAQLNLFGSGTVDNTTRGKAPILNNGFCIIKDTFITKSSSDYYAVLNHGRMTLGSGVRAILPDNANSSLVVNGYYDYTSENERLGHVANVNLAYPVLTIQNGEYIGGKNTLKNDDGGVCTINGGTFRNNFIDENSPGACLFNVNNLVVNYAEVITENTIAVYNIYYSNTTDVGYTKIMNGLFTGSIVNKNPPQSKIQIYGGTFSDDVSMFRQE